jgi:hypothetical protein
MSDADFAALIRARLVEINDYLFPHPDSPPKPIWLPGRLAAFQRAARRAAEQLAPELEARGNHAFASRLQDFAADSLTYCYDDVDALRVAWRPIKAALQKAMVPPPTAEDEDALTKQQRKLIRFLESQEGKRASIRDAMQHMGKQHASQRARSSFLQFVRRLNERLAERRPPHQQLDLDRTAKSLTLIETERLQMPQS